MDIRWFFNSDRDSRGRNRDNPPPNNDEGDDIPRGFRRDDFDMDPFQSFNDPLHMFDHMNDLLGRMFSVHVGFEDVGGQFGGEETTPRSSMLKDPESSDCSTSCGQKQLPSDSDTDDKVYRHGDKSVFDVWNENTGGRTVEDFFNPTSTEGNVRSYGAFSSVSKIRLPDGSFEETRTSTDNRGNKTTTVRRFLGDQMHEVTTKSDCQGLKEKENFQNLDADNLTEFDKKWESVYRGRVTTPSDMQPAKVSISNPVGDPSYVSLFKRFFGF